MKCGAVNCVKFKRLKHRLSLYHWQAVGLLESLWLFTAQNAPQGDIGRFTDEDIAIAIEWGGEPEKLIQMLVDCGWLDTDKTNRLLVHDWADHCPTFVKANAARLQKQFFSKSASKTASKSGSKSISKNASKSATKSGSSEASSEASTLNHDQAKPLPHEYMKSAGEVQGMNLIILHKPEEAGKLKLKSFDDFAKSDVISIACTVCDEFTGPGMGAFTRWLKTFARDAGDAKACNSARNTLFEFWSELRAGEEPNSRTAALLARCRKIFDDKKTNGRK